MLRGLPHLSAWQGFFLFLPPHILFAHAKRNLTKNSWSYRTVYFKDFDGKEYKIKMSVAMNGTIESIYNVGELKEKTSTNGESRLTPQRAVDVSNNSIRDNSGNVNSLSQKSKKKQSAMQLADCFTFFV